MIAKTQTQTQKLNTRTFAFEQENFPSLLLRDDLSEVWNDIGLNSLPPVEQEGLIALLEESGITVSSNYAPHQVLLVKAEGGIPKGLYGPGIFRDGETIILKVGNNIAPITQQGDRLIVGSLKGKISIQEKEDSSGNKYPVATCSLVAKDKTVFKIRVSLDTQSQSFTFGDLDAALINEESILPYLAIAPAPAMKMHELGLGEWEVMGISQSDAGQYGVSFKLHLATGQVVWATGNVRILLEGGYTKRPGTPLCLVVSAIEEVGGDKYRVTCALRERLPRLTDTTKAQTQPQTVETTVVEVNAEEEQVTSNSEENIQPTGEQESSSETIDDKSLDEIPF